MEEIMEKIVQIATTCDNREVLERLGRGLVEKRLVACAQLMGPVQSVYRWKGQVEESREWLLLMKSKGSLTERVEMGIRQEHPYEVPEIIVTDIVGGLAQYLDWVAEETE